MTGELPKTGPQRRAPDPDQSGDFPRAGRTSAQAGGQAPGHGAGGAASDGGPAGAEAPGDAQPRPLGAKQAEAKEAKRERFWFRFRVL